LKTHNAFTADHVKAERQSARMSKIKNGGLGQYGAGPFEQQQSGTTGVEGDKGGVSNPRNAWRVRTAFCSVSLQ